MSSDLSAKFAVLDAFFDDPKKWTQGAFARRDDKLTVDPNHTRATCWCLVGAMRKNFGPAQRQEMRQHLRELLHGRSVWGFNDDPNTTFADVKALLKMAAAHVR